MSEPGREKIANAAKRSRERDAAALRDPEPSLAKRFGQIGVLGWVIVGPMMLGVIVGNWLDHLLGSGIMLSAALTMLGAALGLWLAMRWMNRQ
ncbi:AtpZ/AtpI family protein [Citreicella sp. C3M06]|uniref:AtpZ/AtpI family protein n=1 Tax=Roseobacteraceae TaxID=2854170 RepID=UPI001C08F210|nr:MULTISPECIES: AtpZ/AtpI family protein [Roseobacteraceae]MBU2963207.1 AtpZ/AtpI family protein [Citreicella sp. C3M06]MDO6586555.1 AtpZ/AtpI family protein [Salipiger sp. 1_MG-2023]